MLSTRLSGRTISILVVLFVLAAPCPTQAQSLWTKPYQPNQISLELLQPALDTTPNEDLAFTTGAGALSASYLITERTSVVAQLPFAHYGSEIGDDEPVTVSESALGNPYLGLGLSSIRVPLLVELGVRVPLATDSTAATLAGVASDIDQREAFAQHRLATHLLFNTRWELSRVVSVRFRGGPLLTAPVQEGYGSTELYVRYSAQAWLEGDRYVFGLGLTGRSAVTEGGSFTDASSHQAGGTLIFNFPYVRPGILIRVPLNGPTSDAVGVVFGLTLSTSF